MPLAAAVLFVLATILGAVSPVQRAFTAVRSRTIDINVLMVIAVAGALALGEWLEGASVVFLFAVAQWLEVRTMERARQAIRALIDLSPREALVRRADREQRVAVEDVTIGEEIVLRPGDKVPLDGVVVEGHSDVNEAPLTGESLPIDKARRRRGVRRHDQRPRRARGAGDASGARYAPGAHHPSRRDGAGAAARRCSRSSIASRACTRRR